MTTKTQCKSLIILIYWQTYMFMINAYPSLRLIYNDCKADYEDCYIRDVGHLFLSVGSIPWCNGSLV